MLRVQAQMVSKFTNFLTDFVLERKIKKTFLFAFLKTFINPKYWSESRIRISVVHSIIVFRKKILGVKMAAVGSLTRVTEGFRVSR